MMLWKTIDLPALWAVLDFQGFRLDVEAWKQLAVANKERVSEIDEDLPLNPRSPKQVLARLQKVDKRITSTGVKQLQMFLHRHPHTEEAKLVEQILESRKFGKRASTYGESFLENMVEHVDGLDLVFSDYSINGAETSRMAASGGMHNIPIRDTKEFRKCFIARPKHKLVIADYDSQEATITAFLTQDERLIEIVKSGEKIYIAVARDIFNQEVKKGTVEYAKAKAIVLGMDFGMTEYGLAQRLNISKLEAIELIEKFYQTFPGVERWVNKQEKNTTVAYTVLGRKCWLNKYSSQCRNNSLNDPHQGTAADITKKALGYIHKDWSSAYEFPFCVVGVFHDEIVLDVPEGLAEHTKRFVSDRMVKAAEEICQEIPFKVDATIAGNWSQKE
jgi:DNA polymerase-1